MREVVFEGSVEWVQVLDPEGNVDQSLEPSLDEGLLLEMYRLMVQSRAFDEKALKLQREGRLGTYASSEGQEASQIGSALALEREDWLFPTYREHGAAIARGMPMDLLYLYWMGSEEGSRIPGDVNNFVNCIPVGTQIPHAVGAAWAAKIKGDKTVVMAYLGDGATSEGDFHEGMNFAGVFKVPVVFVCQNNQYAISVPRERQTASATLAQKALAYGFEGVQVDGNDILAVYATCKQAVERAREGGGPTFVECVTYRLGAHTTADDPTRYRSQEEVDSWRKKDPLVRFRKYLENKGLWSQELEEKTHRRAVEQVEAAVQKAESYRPDPLEMFKYMYEEMPGNLAEQMEELARELGGGDG